MGHDLLQPASDHNRQVRTNNESQGRQLIVIPAEAGIQKNGHGYRLLPA
jgi:hypothetical protein